MINEMVNIISVVLNKKTPTLLEGGVTLLLSECLTALLVSRNKSTSG